MTQQDLAQKVGIKFQQIQKYETGANRVSASRLWGIAAVLEVPVGYFFEGIETSEPGMSCGKFASDEVMMNREALDLIRSFYAIPEEQRRHLFELAKVLSEAA